MRKNSNHVVASGEAGGWAVRKSGSTRSSRSFKTKADAVSYGRKISRKEKTELYIHKRDGTIQDRSSYGIDSFPTKS